MPSALCIDAQIPSKRPQDVFVLWEAGFNLFVRNATILKLRPLQIAVSEGGIVKATVFEVATGKGHSYQRSALEIASFEQAMAKPAVLDRAFSKTNVNEPGLDYLLTIDSLFVTFSSLDQNAFPVIEFFIEDHSRIESTGPTSKAQSSKLSLTSLITWHRRWPSAAFHERC